MYQLSISANQHYFLLLIQTEMRNKICYIWISYLIPMKTLSIIMSSFVKSGPKVEASLFLLTYAWYGKIKCNCKWDIIKSVVYVLHWYPAKAAQWFSNQSTRCLSHLIYSVVSRPPLQGWYSMGRQNTILSPLPLILPSKIKYTWKVQ